MITYVYVPDNMYMCVLDRCLSTLRLNSLFIFMSQSKPNCCICDTTIQTPSDGRTITSKQFNRLKPYFCRETTTGKDRGHIFCVRYPHKIVTTKVPLATPPALLMRIPTPSYSSSCTLVKRGGRLSAIKKLRNDT